MIADPAIANLEMALADRLHFPCHRRLAEAGRTLETPAFTWPSVQRQVISHEAVLEFYGGGSVLDIGCGMGELSERVSGRYVGVDLEPAFIEEARSRYPSGEFHCGSLEDAPADQFDYVIAIGPFCYVQGGTYEDDMARFRELFAGIYGRSRIGALITFSSGLASAPFQAERPELRFHDPAFWLTYAGQMSRCLMLKHYYLPSEFVLAVFREPSEWPSR